MRRLDVFLQAVRVGQLSEEDDGRVSIRFAEGYRSLSERPILSQSFEDDLFKTYRGPKDGRLPSFFANLIPEGHLRQLVEQSVGLATADDFGLLAAVGNDLPGAVIVRPAADLIGGDQQPLDEPEQEVADDGNGHHLKFSLAGVQLKFSMREVDDRLTLPAHGGLGNWIVKFPSLRFSRLPENEFATMEWARRSGFDVPTCFLAEGNSVPADLRGYIPSGERVFVVRRFDRAGTDRVHQEDFAQVVGFQPKLKYDFTFEKIATVVRAVGGEDQYYEFVRRLAFMIASGNTDAHLKNWSFLYRDGIEAILSPLYDQVATVSWQEVHPPKLALKLAKRRLLTTIDDSAITELARRVDADPQITMSHFRDAVGVARNAWRELGVSALFPEEHRTAIVNYWRSVPVLRAHGELE